MVSAFLDDRCEREPGAFAASNDLLEAYNRWAREGGHGPNTAEALGARHRTLGFDPVSTGNARGWKGLRLNPTQAN